VARRNVVYVLDDDPDVLRGLERLLKVHGFRSKLFESAEAFFGSTHNDEALCLLLDVHLNGTSGVDVKRQLMRSGAALPVIFITAKDNEATRRLIEEVGCVSYLPKPFSAQSLMDAIALVDQDNPPAARSLD
jgi:FixJ family two-component response regulator